MIHTKPFIFGLISNPKIFYRYCQFKGLLTKFRSGNFLIRKGSSSLDIIETLLKGASIAPKLTIPEGKNIYEIGKMLEKRKICSYKAFIKATKDKNVAKKLKPMVEFKVSVVS